MDAAPSKPEELRDRTKHFALRVVRLFRSLPTSPDAQVMGKQLLRCGTSVAANYRAVCRPRSRAEFVARIGISGRGSRRIGILDRAFERIERSSGGSDSRTPERSAGTDGHIYQISNYGKGAEKITITRLLNYPITQ